MRFPPAGQRGIALGIRGQGFGRVGHAEIGTLNDVVLGVFQIENASAVADAEAIAAQPGADVLFVGPGRPVACARRPGPVRRPDVPRRHRRGRRGLPGARQGGRHPPVRPGRRSRPHLERGFRFIGLGSDGGFVMNGAKAMLAAAGRG